MKNLSYNINSSKGFALIELSVIILIIGILTAGVSSGGKVLERAKLVKLSIELSNVQQAFLLFNDTYNAVPGDYSGSGSDVNCGQNSLLEICSGDGDGKIEVEADGTVTAVNDYNCTRGTTAGDCEFVYAKNHLIYEGFLPNSFAKDVEGTNKDFAKFPKSFASELIWRMAYYQGNVDNNGSTINANKNNSNITSGTNIALIKENSVVASNATTAPAANGFLNAQFAGKLDQKVDDGYPTMGIIGYYVVDLTTGTTSQANINKCIVENTVGSGTSAVKYMKYVDSTTTTDNGHCQMSYNLSLR